MKIPSFKEDHISQIPALQVLQNLGYTCLTPEEAMVSRGNETANVILEDPSRTSRDFFEHFFEDGLLNRGLKKIAHEGGRAHRLLNVTPGDYFNLHISVPEHDEQQKIAEVLNAATRETETLKQKLDALKDQKKGLMQQLLTGKKRLNYDSND